MPGGSSAPSGTWENDIHLLENMYMYMYIVYQGQLCHVLIMHTCYMYICLCTMINVPHQLTNVEIPLASKIVYQVHKRLYMYMSCTLCSVLIAALTHCAHLDSMVLPQLAKDTPCYIFYRLDDRNAHQNYLWVFMAYIPDDAKVRGTCSQ